MENRMVANKIELEKIFPDEIFSEKNFPHPGVPIAFISATLEHQRMTVEKTAPLSFHIPPPPLSILSNNRIHVGVEAV